jgi:hypothetical protein
VVEAWEGDVERQRSAVADYEDLDFDVEDWDEDAGGREDGADDVIALGPDKAERADHRRMVAVLGQLGEAPLLERFIGRVVTPRFDGGEAVALAEAAGVLEVGRWAEVFSRLVQQNMTTAPRGCVSLLVQLIRSQHAPEHPERTAVLSDVAAAVVAALPRLDDTSSPADRRRGSGPKSASTVDAGTLADLLDGLATLEAASLREAACEAVVANGRAFDSRMAIVPALCTLCDQGRRVSGDDELERLWLHAADGLLARSEYPPEPPGDWRQSVDLACDCGDCRALAAFARDPAEHVLGFPLRKDRRQHLHRQIDRHRLDMTHVTERRGRPFTLVCTKTRWSYERQRRSYRQDVAALELLANLAENLSGPFASRRARIAAARERASGEEGAAISGDTADEVAASG